MKKQTTQIGGRDVLLYTTDEAPKALLIQTLGKQELGIIDHEVEMIQGAVFTPFVMAAFAIGDWEVELTPWHDPEVSDRKEVGENALETLEYVTDKLIPVLIAKFGSKPVIIGGYSLGGLFSRWAVSESECFTAAACCSPSLWINAWQGFSVTHQVFARFVYLSLGDSEEFTKNKAIAQVGNNIRWEYEHLKNAVGSSNCTLEWNRGNHFRDGAGRMAKGFSWCLNKLYLS